MKLVRWIDLNLYGNLTYHLSYREVPLARIKKLYTGSWSWQTFNLVGLVGLRFACPYLTGQAGTLGEAMHVSGSIITSYGFRILTDKETNLL